jgi:hypothetical protein
MSERQRAAKQQRRQAWDVIRYIPVPGATPDEDPCAFDGWFFIQSWAQEVYDYWCERYPDWIVALVVQDRVRFSNKQLELPSAVRAQLRVLHGKGDDDVEGE